VTDLVGLAALVMVDDEAVLPRSILLAVLKTVVDLELVSLCQTRQISKSEEMRLCMRCVLNGLHTTGESLCHFGDVVCIVGGRGLVVLGRDEQGEAFSYTSVSKQNTSELLTTNISS
jgi:hypothetical protein